MTPWREPVRDPSAWTAADLERDRSWDYELSARQQRELEVALRFRSSPGRRSPARWTIDAEWDGYVRDMMDAGLERLLMTMADQGM